MGRGLGGDGARRGGGGGGERVGYLGQPRALAYSTACSSPSRKAACLPGTAPSPISPLSRSPAERTGVSRRSRPRRSPPPGSAPRRTGGRVDQHQPQARFPRRARQRLGRLRVRPGDLGCLEARAARRPEPRGEARELGEQPRHVGREAERSHSGPGTRAGAESAAGRKAEAGGPGRARVRRPAERGRSGAASRAASPPRLPRLGKDRGWSRKRRFSRPEKGEGAERRGGQARGAGSGRGWDSPPNRAGQAGPGDPWAQSTQRGARAQ